MTDTATVETLVAEVRTLMVGSRQVTLSVAKQLDEIALHDLLVFGRVKMVKGEDHVIGAAPDGTLALAKYRRGVRFSEGPWSEIVTGSVRVCRKSVPERGAYRLKYGERTVEVPAGDTVPCEGHEGKPCAWAALDPRVGEWFDEAISEFDSRVDIHERAASAPLIVLAGLK